MSQETEAFGIKVRLTGTDGNGMVLISRCRQAARKAGIDKARIEAFTNEAMSGDYDHLLQTCMRYFDVS